MVSLYEFESILTFASLCLLPLYLREMWKPALPSYNLNSLFPELLCCRCKYPLKTNITMESPRFEDVFPIENRHFPASHVSELRGVTPVICLFLMFSNDSFDPSKASLVKESRSSSLTSLPQVLGSHKPAQ